jgi:hypothetical protein
VNLENEDMNRLKYAAVLAMIAIGFHAAPQTLAPIPREVEWDGKQWVSISGARDRQRAYWSGTEWIKRPSIQEEEKIKQEELYCIDKKLFAMKTDAAVKLLRQACGVIAWSGRSEISREKDRHWLHGKCMLEKITGTEPHEAISDIVAICTAESKSPPLMRMIELCVIRGSC